MRHSVPHDLLTQQRQPHEECREGLTDLNAWPTKGLTPARKNAQRSWGENVKCLAPTKSAFASMFHFYAGKGILFWKIRSLRVAACAHTHTHHHSYLMCEGTAHSTAIQLWASQIINRLPIQAAAVSLCSAFSPWFIIFQRWCTDFYRFFSVLTGTTCTGQWNLFLRLFTSDNTPC